MPGILGFVNYDRQRQSAVLLSKLVDSFTHSKDFKIETFLDSSKDVAFSRLHLGIHDQGEQPVYSADRKSVILFDGELYDNTSGAPDPQYILKRYENLQDRCVKQLEGMYAFVVFDSHQRLIRIFTDHLGLKPVYYYQSSSGFYFASEVKGLLPFYEGNKKRDNKTVADFFVFGFPIGDETLFEDIKLIPAASCLTYDLVNKKYFIRKYWDLLELFTPEKEWKRKNEFDVIVDSFKVAVKKRTSNIKQLGLSLSGGLDSRSILAAMEKQARGLHTYTVGVRNCRDQVLAEKMSHMAGTKHHFVEINQDYLHRFMEIAHNYIYLTDGFYHPHELTEIQVLDYLKEAPFKILMRGHGGEFAKASLAFPVKINKKLLELRDSGDIIRWIISETRSSFASPVDLKLLLAPDFYKKVENQAFASLSRVLDDSLHILAPCDVILYFYMDQFSRRLSMACMDIFRTQVEIRMPYFDLQFLKLLFEIPIDQRYDGSIQHKIIRQCNSELMSVPDSNTGARLDALPWNVYLLDKMNTLMRRLSWNGFRHYTEYEDWQRKYYANGIKKTLFEEKALSRGIYNLPCLREVYDQHLAGKRNYAHLLGTAVGLELWHQQFFDE